MKKKYQVLWIDDQCDKFTGFIERGDKKDIEFTKAKTMEEGLKLYRTYLNKWDGVILDGYFFKNSLNGDMNAGALIDTMNEISKLETKRYVPYFIFSAYTEELKKVLGNDRKIYDKFTDVSGLLNDIILEADNLIETQIKKEYWDIFEAYPEYYESLLDFLKNAITKEKPILNEMRSFMDNKFINSFYAIGFSKKIDKLKGLANHLQGHDIKIVPEYIKKSFKNLEEKTNYGSHEQNNTLDKGHPYLIRSAVLDLLNILYWFKELPVDDTSKDKYRSSSEKLFNSSSDEKIEGSIQINENGKLYLSYNDNAIKPEDYGKSFVIYRNKLKQFKPKK